MLTTSSVTVINNIPNVVSVVKPTDLKKNVVATAPIIPPDTTGTSMTLFL